jgi:hypothetical protein
MKFVSLLLIWVCSSASALEVTEDFSSRAQFASATAIWNTASGKIQPTIRAINYKAGSTPIDLDVGDGSHGAFTQSRFLEFSPSGTAGAVIRLNTDEYPSLNVTSFNLPAGWTLEPTGTSPLVIRSLGDVQIRGEINCKGRNGTNAVSATPGTGGAGRCGGQIGGNGGATSQAGQSGASSETPVTGGGGGNFSGGAAVGGGGGGGWSVSNTAANGPNSGVGGLAGSSSSDPDFLSPAGGAGGGGGSGTTTEAGAGGGGGGGLVRIFALGNVELGTATTSFDGFILVNGGDGGGSNVNGGPGGGGGGGSVQIFSAGQIRRYNIDGNGFSQATGGLGGLNAVPAGGAYGSDGRSWFSASITGPGFYSPTEEAPVSRATIVYATTAQQIETKSYDLGSSFPFVNRISVSATSTEFSLQYAASKDNFSADTTGWTSDLNAIQGRRYLKVKLILNNSNQTTPTTIDSFTITYEPGQIDDFEFQVAGCGRVSDRSLPTGGSGLLLLPLLLMLFSRQKYRRLEAKT